MTKWSEETVEAVAANLRDKHPVPMGFADSRWLARAALSAISNSNEWEAREWRPIAELKDEITGYYLVWLNPIGGVSDNSDWCVRKVWCSGKPIHFDDQSPVNDELASRMTHFQYLPTPPTEASDGK